MTGTTENIFFRDSRVSAVLKSSCITYTLRFLRAGLSYSHKKIQFSEVP